MTSLKIFVILLENDKWFLHVSSLPNDVLLECEALFDFVKKNKPIKIYETLPFLDALDINTWTKRYMNYFGMDNVRGGIYSEEIIDEKLLQALEIELSTSIENYEEKLSIFHRIRNKENLLITDFEEDMQKYKNLLQHGYKQFTRDFFDDLEWLKQIVENSIEDNSNYKPGIFTMRQENNKTYRKIIKNIGILNTYYYKLDEEKVKVKPSVLLYKPEFIFDRFIYHPSDIKNFQSEINTALDYINKYEFMGYTLINVLDEMEYDFFN
jgi:hypothetical protein